MTNDKDKPRTCFSVNKVYFLPILGPFPKVSLAIYTQALSKKASSARPPLP